MYYPLLLLESMLKVIWSIEILAIFTQYFLQLKQHTCYVWQNIPDIGIKMKQYLAPPGQRPRTGARSVHWRPGKERCGRKYDLYDSCSQCFFCIAMNWLKQSWGNRSGFADKFRWWGGDSLIKKILYVTGGHLNIDNFPLPSISKL